MKKDLRICPKCGEYGGYVWDSRPQPNGSILRRRKCPYCNATWKSIEVSAEYLNFLISLICKLRKIYNKNYNRIEK